MEATHFLCSYQFPNGEKPGHKSQVWAVAMQAVLMQRLLWHALEARGSQAATGAFLGDDALRFAVSLAEDAHTSLRDAGWQDRQSQQRAELSVYVQLLQQDAPTVEDASLILEVFADALVLSAWLVEVDFFASSRTQSERAMQLQESVLALAPRRDWTL